MNLWLQVELTIPATAADAVTQALQQLAALAISLGDPGGEPILEPGPGATPLWSQVIVTALLPPETGEDAVRSALSRLRDPPLAGFRFAYIEERDWVREFRQNLGPMRFGERLWICPTDMPCPDAAGVALTLEPGLAFGSGSHPTTALCLRWLAALDLGALTVLDWGCGSGVLAIAALALGARSATALDIDPQARQATADNARRNGYAGGVRIAEPARLPLGAQHDVVVANILADTLIAIATALRQHARNGARVALSGILAAQAERVRAACAPWFALRLAAELGGWVLLAGTARP